MATFVGGMVLVTLPHVCLAHDLVLPSRYRQTLDAFLYIVDDAVQEDRVDILAILI